MEAQPGIRFSHPSNRLFELVAGVRQIFSGDNTVATLAFKPFGYRRCPIPCLNLANAECVRKTITGIEWILDRLVAVFFQLQQRLEERDELLDSTDALFPHASVSGLTLEADLESQGASLHGRNSKLGWLDQDRAVCLVTAHNRGQSA
jgi:hypothetical protein